MEKNAEKFQPSFTLQISMENGRSEDSINASRYGGNEDRPTYSFGEISSGSAFAPEKKLTLFALRLSILEKAASRLGALGFVWATVVLLGGFAITLSNKDFWVVTIILLVESARIFSRSHELEWQHQSFNSRGSVSALNFRTWESNNVPFLPYLRWFFLSKNMSFILYWLQILSAFVCVFLSLERLTSQDFGGMEKCDADKRNRKAALCLFYATALSEALLFLVEKIYWVWKVSFCKLLVRVSEECGFGDDGVAYMRRFFYDSYSMCINGSIFDGIKMDLISFAEELVCSTSDNEQLMGARIIQNFVRNERFSFETLKKVGRSEKLMKRFLEMLNWRNTREKEIRVLAAEIISKLAGKKHDSLNIYMISGAMESIASLLFCAYFETNVLGLMILKKIARDQDNCFKIGKIHGLLPKIMTFTGQFGSSQILGQRYSLALVNRLTRSTGSAGEKLRKEISENVFLISNIREILQRGGKQKELQKTGIQILTRLAMGEEGKERIGGAGGMIEELVRVFLNRRIEGGEALVMLTMNSAGNCERIMKLGIVDRLVSAIKDPLLTVNVSRIMRNLCVHGEAALSDQLKGVIAAAIPAVSASP